MAILNFDSGELLIALMIGLLPALFWLWFWLKEDKKKPEPKKMIFLIFLTGGLSVIPAHILISWSMNFLESYWGFSLNFRDLETQATITPIIYAIIFAIGAFWEELMKLGAAGLALKSSFFDEPIDAMIYLITAGLGFAAIENTFYFLDLLMNSQSMYLALGQSSLRFLGSTLVHVVSAATLGAFIALAWNQSQLRRIIMFSLGFLLAVTLHAAFNFFIIQSVSYSEIWRIFLSLWLVVIFIILLFEKVKQINY